MTIGSESRAAQELWGKRFFMHARGQKNLKNSRGSVFIGLFFHTNPTPFLRPQPQGRAEIYIPIVYT